MKWHDQFPGNGSGRRAAAGTARAPTRSVGRRWSAAAKRSLFPVPRPPSPAPRAFTLVELLVVVTIIGMLVGLLMPAVMAARSRARVIQCTNHQKELATAIQLYETAKRHLPGYANQVSGTTVSWVPVLFPYLGRNDLWEGATGWRSGNTTYAPYIGQLVCPNDVNATGAPQLTYVVSCGLYNDLSGIPSNPLDRSAPGVFRDYSAGSTDAVISLSDINSPAQTVMLSERVYDIHYPVLYPEKYWNTSTPTVSKVGFLWPGSGVPPTLIGQHLFAGGNLTVPAPLPAIHPGVVIVTFCDGHVAEIAEETPCNLYYGAP